MLFRLGHNKSKSHMWFLNKCIQLDYICNDHRYAVLKVRLVRINKKIFMFYIHVYLQ